MKRFMDDYKNESFDILVIGGGITGAAVAYDAASRGLSVALVEKREPLHDFQLAFKSASSGFFPIYRQAMPKVRGHILTSNMPVSRINAANSSGDGKFIIESAR